MNSKWRLEVAGQQKDHSVAVVWRLNHRLCALDLRSDRPHSYSSALRFLRQRPLRLLRPPTNATRLFFFQLQQELKHFAREIWRNLIERLQSLSNRSARSAARAT